MSVHHSRTAKNTAFWYRVDAAMTGVPLTGETLFKVALAEAWARGGHELPAEFPEVSTPRTVELRAMVNALFGRKNLLMGVKLRGKLASFLTMVTPGLTVEARYAEFEQRVIATFDCAQPTPRYMVNMVEHIRSTEEYKALETADDATKAAVEAMHKGTPTEDSMALIAACQACYAQRSKAWGAVETTLGFMFLVDQYQKQLECSAEQAKEEVWSEVRAHI